MLDLYIGNKLGFQSLGPYCYGRDVFAPADGTVICFRNDRPDSKTYGNGSTDSSVKDIRGNFIVIRHTDKEYSFIAHLLPGSITVKKGQQVKRGERIARCGNSGNTSEPHIHFHIQDGKGIFTSAGLPVVFDGINTGYAENYDKYDPRKTYIPQATEALYVHRGQYVENISST
ncbi:MAG: M23 family metallopeptidase [Clostridiaceae bacterium]|nr:M23 family metallopeptidase [Clostridiaceae bacterium]